MNKENKKIIIFAAGTGGHVYPGLSIANELMRNNISVLWIGTEKGIEKIIIGNSKIPIKYIQFSGIRGKGIFSYIKLPYKLIKSIIQSFKQKFPLHLLSNILTSLNLPLSNHSRLVS